MPLLKFHWSRWIDEQGVALFDNGIDFTPTTLHSRPDYCYPLQTWQSGLPEPLSFPVPHCLRWLCSFFDGILPVVAASRIFAGILNAHFVAGVPFFSTSWRVPQCGPRGSLLRSFAVWLRFGSSSGWCLGEAHNRHGINHLLWYLSVR